MPGHFIIRPDFEEVETFVESLSRWLKSYLNRTVKKD
jgi:hypothetical protein